MISVIYLLGGFAVSGCSMEPVLVRDLQLNYSKPMVGKKLDVPLCIVASKADFPSDLLVEGKDVKPIEVHYLRTFLKRDVAEALGAWFASVTVQAADPAPDAPCAVARFRLSSIRTIAKTAMAQSAYGTATAFQIFALVDWSVGIRGPREAEFFYTYNERVQGRVPLVTVSQTGALIGSALEDALDAFLADFKGHDVVGQLRAKTAPAPEPVAPPAAAPAKDAAKPAKGGGKAKPR